MDMDHDHNTLIDGVTVTGMLSGVGALMMIFGCVHAWVSPAFIAESYIMYVYIGLIVEAIVAALKPHLIWRLVGVCAFSVVASMLLVLAIASTHQFFKF